MDRGAWWATVQGVAEELHTTQQLNNKNLRELNKKTPKLTKRSFPKVCCSIKFLEVTVHFCTEPKQSLRINFS